MNDNHRPDGFNRLDLLEIYSIAFICTAALAEEMIVRLAMAGVAIMIGIYITKQSTTTKDQP